MYQAPRVQQRQCRARVVGDRADLLPWQGSELAQIPAVEQLHRVVGVVTVRRGVKAVVEGTHDARVGELGEGVKLTLEQFDDHAHPAGLGQPFERKTFAGGAIAHAVGSTHAAATERGEHVVAARDAFGFGALWHRVGRFARGSSHRLAVSQYSSTTVQLRASMRSCQQFYQVGDPRSKGSLERPVGTAARGAYTGLCPHSGEALMQADGGDDAGASPRIGRPTSSWVASVGRAYPSASSSRALERVSLPGGPLGRPQSRSAESGVHRWGSSPA